MDQIIKTIYLGVFLLPLLWNTTDATNANVGADSQKKKIETIRKGILTIKGKPNANVQVEQLKHEFWFGCAISSKPFYENSKMSESDIKMYKEKFLENFNSAVTENALKWHAMEQKQGEIDYKTTDNILDWTEANNLPLRGHNLYWGIHNRVQDWLKELNEDDLRKALKKRGIETATRYKDRFEEYDLNNEMIHGNYYAEKLGEGITKEMVNWVLESDKDAKLWLNDYDILTGKRLDDFMQHIRTLLKDGVPIAGIGVQGHLHGETFSREMLKQCLDSLATFGLPIRITEFNIPGQRSRFLKDNSLVLTEEEELRKAKDLTDYYRICFAHPAVEGILMWGFWEGANWIKASSLYYQDWSPTPALKAYQDLIFNEWNTNISVTLDEKGEANVDAFYGDYKLTSGDKELLVSLKKESGSKLINLEK